MICVCISSFSNMSDTTFTLDEAHALLPVLESLLRQAMAGKEKVAEFEREFQEVQARVFLTGGALLDVHALSLRKAEQEKAIQHVKDAVTEIHATGVQIKDLDIGLLDFPCVVDGETILLCWKMGEKCITHWHGLEEGFKGRKPIDDRIAKAKKPLQ